MGEINRSLQLCTLTEDVEHEKGRILHKYLKNDYPLALILEALRAWKPKTEEKNKPGMSNKNNSTKGKKWVSLPYIPEINPLLKRELGKFGIGVFSRSTCTVKTEASRSWAHLRDSVKSEQPSSSKKSGESGGVVYAVPCLDCRDIYVGQTKRDLDIRLTEHKRAVAKGDKTNGISAHVNKTGHNPGWEKTKIVYKEKDPALRLNLEGITIAANESRVMNLAPPSGGLKSWLKMWGELLPPV